MFRDDGGGVRASPAPVLILNYTPPTAADPKQMLAAHKLAPSAKATLGKAPQRPAIQTANTIPDITIIKRKTYLLAGQPVAIRITGSPTPTNAGLYFI